MLFALLLGMALNFLAKEGRCRPGIQLAATHLLRADRLIERLRHAEELESSGIASSG